VGHEWIVDNREVGVFFIFPLTGAGVLGALLLGFPVALLAILVAIDGYFLAIMALGLPFALLNALVNRGRKDPHTAEEIAEWERKHPWGKRYRLPAPH
jgi:hypothetical protein